MEKTLTAETAQDMNPWELAQLLGIQFTGDMNPFDHGGTFYETSNWHHGYANCVRFLQVDGKTLVESAMINKLEGEDLKLALDCIGLKDEDYDVLSSDQIECAHIEACLAYYGADTHEDFGGKYIEEFDEESEGEAWKTALPWIQNLN